MSAEKLHLVRSRFQTILTGNGLSCLVIDSFLNRTDNKTNFKKSEQDHVNFCTIKKHSWKIWFLECNLKNGPQERFFNRPSWSPLELTFAARDLTNIWNKFVTQTIFFFAVYQGSVPRHFLTSAKRLNLNVTQL